MGVFDTIEGVKHGEIPRHPEVMVYNGLFVVDPKANSVCPTADLKVSLLGKRILRGRRCL